MKFNDYIPNNDNEVRSTILKCLGSSKKIISNNYTRNNFELLKKYYPKFWSYIDGKTFTINNKKISFEQRNQFTLFINGKKFIKSYANDKQIWEKLKNITFPLDNNINEVKQLLYELVSVDPRSFDILRFIKKFYPNFYNSYLTFFLDGSTSHREVIYRAMHEIYVIPNINGVKLKFSTYNNGYDAKNIYNELQNIDINDEHEVLNVFINKLKNEKKTPVHLKKFFPNLYNKINEKYSCKFFSTKVMMYFYNLSELPKCLECGKTINEKNTYTFYKYCSLKCARQHFSKETTTLAEKLYGKDWLIEWEKYKDLINRFTSISYSKFKTIINPMNFSRTKYTYHLDHIIPKSYGFLNKIDPKIISHYKNLQMLSAHDNLVKGKNVLDINFVNELLLTIKTELTDNNYFKE